MGAGERCLVPVGQAGYVNLEELERHYILQVLQQVGWIISGSTGAAAKLGMKRTTLQSKMLRLGITREEFGC